MTMSSSYGHLLCLLLALILTLPHARANSIYFHTNQFRQWYPQYGEVFSTILHTKCTAQYDHYLVGIVNSSTEINRFEGGDEASALTQPVIQCIFSHLSEFIKSQISSAQVLLGVAPTILALLGPSMDETAVFFLVGRRPLMSLLLACGSPSVYFDRAFKYSEPTGLLADHPLRLRQDPIRGPFRVLVVLLEYLFAGVAVANVALVDYELGVKTICVIMTDWIWAPMFWGFLTILIHGAAAVVTRLRMRRLGRDEHPTGRDIGLREWARRHLRMPGLLYGWEVAEWRVFSSSSRGDIGDNDVRIDVFPESKEFIVLAWVLSAGTICNILFGTLILSSTVFIGPRDALAVVARYMASVMVCRVVLMYELANLRNAKKRTDENGGTSTGGSSNVYVVEVHEERKSVA